MNTKSKPGDIGIGHISVGDDRMGWGFGHRGWVDDHQGYSWAGVEIPKTVFEISVKSVNLTILEKKWLLQ